MMIRQGIIKGLDLRPHAQESKVIGGGLILNEDIIGEYEPAESRYSPRTVTLRYDGLFLVQIGKGRSIHRFYFADEVIEFLRKRRTVMNTKA